MTRIFISYRRADTEHVVGRMYDRLWRAFGRENVFKDVDSIALGDDYSEVIAKRLSDSDVVIVVIGPSWLAAEDTDGKPRLQNPADLVRMEIEGALSTGVPAIPALVGIAAMPQEQQLPESIRQLTRRNAIAIRSDPDFDPIWIGSSIRSVLPMPSLAP